MKFIQLLFITLVFVGSVFSQDKPAPNLLTLDRIYNSKEFRQQYPQPTQWIENGNAYAAVEFDDNGQNELVRYDSKTQKKKTFVKAGQLTPKGKDKAIYIESFTLSPDESKVLIFTNSSRVWRANTKGDFWVYDFKTKKLNQIGKEFSSSSLMFAKFSTDNKYVGYVHDFNVYKEEFKTGKVTQLTFDGTKDIINGTFDWVYEEEFGCRDGFRWSPDAELIAYWQLDASDIGTFYMINNTDSIYSQLIPLQYPKVGEDPSACRVAVVGTKKGDIKWIPVPGGAKENYIPGIQWVNSDLLLVQQINRKQNHLKVWKYQPSTDKLSMVYEETEETWVDLSYPDVSSSGWGENDLKIVDNGTAFLRMTENDAWRNVYKINIETGAKTLLTAGDYDVAAMFAHTDDRLFFSASPTNSAQRYLYSVGMSGKGDTIRHTPKKFSGINRYKVSPNGKYAMHSHSNAMMPNTVRLVSLPNHKVVKTLVENSDFKNKLKTIDLPEVEFFTVKTEDGIEVDGRMVKPTNFDPNKKYPVLFHVYGEPWGQVGTDNFIGLWNVMLAQKGYVVISMDNRGTPCLKGSKWRKSIYRKVGIINSRDQAMAAKEVLKWNFIDPARTAVWGWSGGGSMTLNLLFRYPEIYKTGMSVAPVSDQLIYDNIYQERYMGLPQENREDFVEGSPITYAKNLEGNLFLVHGTNDDNVHYQSAELLINELVKHNKIFQMMSYPGRSHGIYEGAGTSLHLRNMLLNYLTTHTEAGGRGEKGSRP